MDAIHNLVNPPLAHPILNSYNLRSVNSDAVSLPPPSHPPLRGLGKDVGEVASGEDDAWAKYEFNFSGGTFKEVQETPKGRKLHKSNAL